MNDADRQLPQSGEIFLDHVGHFVRDVDAARDALKRAGFGPTPISIQLTPDPSGGMPKPSGTGNSTVMFGRGYMEILFKAADTPLGREFDAALARYSGLHLAAFTVADAKAAHARLAGSGFRMQPLVSMQRPADTEAGRDIAAFSIARLEAGQMPEGRMQVLNHLTENTVWRKRFMSHPNGATGLYDLVIVPRDTAEAGERFARLTGKTCHAGPWGQVVALDRSRLIFASPDKLTTIADDLAPPSLPFIAGYGVQVTSLAVLDAVLTMGGIAFKRQGPAVIAQFPPELGLGVWVFVERVADLPWRG